MEDMIAGNSIKMTDSSLSASSTHNINNCLAGKAEVTDVEMKKLRLALSSQYSLLIPLKTEKLWFSDVFRGIKREHREENNTKGKSDKITITQGLVITQIA